MNSTGTKGPAFVIAMLNLRDTSIIPELLINK